MPRQNLCSGAERLALGCAESCILTASLGRVIIPATASCLMVPPTSRSGRSEPVPRRAGCHLANSHTEGSQRRRAAYLRPARSLKGDTMRTLSPARTVGIVFAFCTASAIFSPAQTFTSLASFNSTGGYDPNPGVVQGFDGNFYGTTYNSDSGNRSGTVFEITPSGTFTTLGSFNHSDGANPTAGLTLATTGNFYGTTSTGGANAAGVIFDITPAGNLSAIPSPFSIIICRGPCADGLRANPAPLHTPNRHSYATT